MEADAKYNDTDPCWGPLRRVDVYRVYLVSGLAPARDPAQPGRAGCLEPLAQPSREKGLRGSTLCSLTGALVLAREWVVSLRL